MLFDNMRCLFEKEEIVGICILLGSGFSELYRKHIPSFVLYSILCSCCAIVIFVWVLQSLSLLEHTPIPIPIPISIQTNTQSPSSIYSHPNNFGIQKCDDKGNNQSASSFNRINKSTARCWYFSPSDSRFSQLISSLEYPSHKLL